MKKINNQTDKTICINKMKTLKILFTYKTKNKVQKSIYTVDMSKTVLIGGLNEIGYDLNFYPENTYSNTCMTYTNILKIMKGDVINQHVFTVQAIL